MEKVVRTKTKYRNIYFNESTKKYDVKYNYKIYNPSTQKNEYKSKWIYNCKTLNEAKKELANLQVVGLKVEDKDITLEGAFELWKTKPRERPLSPVTIRNTTQQMKMIYQFLPKETKLKNLNEDVYYRLAQNCRDHGYSDETLHSINATFRKIINVAYKKKMIKENFLDFADNVKTKPKDEYRLISKEEFDKLDNYFHSKKFVRLGVDNYRKYRLLFNILYYTGIRIGEALALTYDDFEHVNYFKKGEEPMSLYIPSRERAKEEHLRCMRIKISKAYVSDMHITKDPKNLKKRTIPLDPVPERLFIKLKNNHLDNGGSISDKIFPWTRGACLIKLQKACKELGLPSYTCHEFRHTFISNLIKNGVPLPVIEKVSGDTQATILKRYSHMFEEDEVMVLLALQKL